MTADAREVNMHLTKAVTLADFPRQLSERDDTGRFLRAYEACSVGGTLIFPQGQFVIPEGISIQKQKQISILGSGKVLTKIIVNGDGIRYHSAGSGHYFQEFTVEDLTIVGKGTGVGIDFRWCFDYSITDVTVTNFAKGVSDFSVWRSNYTNVSTSNCTIGFYVEDYAIPGCPNIRTNCVADYGGTGLEIASSASVYTWSGGEIVGNQNGIKIQTSEKNVHTEVICFIGINFEGNKESDVVIGNSIHAPANIKFINCYFHRTNKGDKCFDVAKCWYLSLDNCKMFNYNYGVYTGQFFSGDLLFTANYADEVTKQYYSAHYSQTQEISGALRIIKNGISMTVKQTIDIKPIVNVKNYCSAIGGNVNIQFETKGKVQAWENLGTVPYAYRLGRDLYFNVLDTDGKVKSGVIFTNGEIKITVQTAGPIKVNFGYLI